MQNWLRCLGRAIPCGKFLLLAAMAGMILFFQPAASQAESFNLGPKKCQECHKAEVEVWEATPHATSFKSIHKSKKAKAIVKAVGGKRMKKEALCAGCHYTTTKKNAGAKPKLAAGPSCESCHGPASDWFAIHNNYGAGKTAATEDAAHKAARIKNASTKGMIWPTQLFDVAANCNSCHGMAAAALPGDKIKAMLDAGHPINAEFEVVEYSQGVVRHRFYPPKVTENQKMTKAEMARLFVVGQAANLVSATSSMSKTDHAAYKAAQQKRIAAATAVLKSIAGQVPEAGKVVASPTPENGRALAAAVAGKDLSGAVGSKLPTSFK